MSTGPAVSSQEIKGCCAAAYSTNWVRLLIGDSMHPGGIRLTERLGDLLELGPGSRVLDIAAGRGVSAIALARRFGCEVVGVDLSAVNVDAAREEAARTRLLEVTSFQVADAEALPFADGEFNAIICECAFCTFPDKARAACEMARVLKPGARLGMSDLVRRGDLAAELTTLAGWIACIADARPESEYARYLDDAGLRRPSVEIHDDALAEFVDQILDRLIGATVFAKLAKLDLAGADLDQATVIGRAAELAVRKGTLGYILLTAVRA